MIPARAGQPAQPKIDVLGELLSFRFCNPEAEARSRAVPEGLAVNGLEAFLDDYARQTREASQALAAPTRPEVQPAQAAKSELRPREAMRRSTIYLTEEQHRLLGSAVKALGRAGGRDVSRSQVVRSALDTLLGDPRVRERRSSLAEAFLFLGEEPPRGL